MIPDIPLGGGDQPRNPTIKFDAVGDVAVFMVADIEEYQTRTFGTGEPRTKPDGSPRMGDRICGIILPNTTATLTNPATNNPSYREPAVPGVRAQTLIEGHRRTALWEGKKESGHDFRKVGMVITMRRLQDVRIGASGQPLAQPMRPMEYRIRPATAQEMAAYGQAAVDFYTERHQGPTLPSASAGAAAPVDSAEEPF